MICNPPSKTDLTTLCSGDLQSPAPGISRHVDGIGDYKSPGLIGRTFFTTDNISVGTPNGVGRLAEDSPMHPPPKTKYSLARNKCIFRGHQIRPRGKNGRNSFHRMRMKMPRLGGSYVAAGAFCVAPDMSCPPLGVPADLQSAVKK